MPVIPPAYPFSAIVGHDRLRLALVLCAVLPGIGGVLIRGEKGTAKSTAARALAAVLAAVDPATRLVELPIGATEDRVIGSLDLQKVLRDGEHAFSPGLLARADGGVLYVDEVNLLPDHLVDILLDAAAMGRVHVERDGVSHSYASRFVLIGTMNPEEGELRPQLLDRFGLAVDVAASRDVPVRSEVIRQRLAYEADPVAFAARYAGPDGVLARQIAAARARVAEVELADAELNRIAALCAAFDVDGMRADLVVARTAVAHAAWRGADSRRRARTSGRPRNWRCRTAAGGTLRRSRASIRPNWTRRCPPPPRLRDPRSGSRPAGGWTGRRGSAGQRTRAPGQPGLIAPARRAPRRHLPDPGADGARDRRRRCRAAVAGP